MSEEHPFRAGDLVEYVGRRSNAAFPAEAYPEVGKVYEVERAVLGMGVDGEVRPAIAIKGFTGRAVNSINDGVWSVLNFRIAKASQVKP